MIDVSAANLARSERLTNDLLVIDLDNNTNTASSFMREGFKVEQRDLDSLYQIMRWPYDLMIICSNYDSCPKEEMYAALRQALSITDYSRKVLLFAEWGIFRDDMLCGIPLVHKLERCYAMNDNEYGWYVWINGRRRE